MNILSSRIDKRGVQHILWWNVIVNCGQSEGSREHFSQCDVGWGAWGGLHLQDSSVQALHSSVLAAVCDLRNSAESSWPRRARRKYSLKLVCHCLLLCYYRSAMTCLKQTTSVVALPFTINVQLKFSPVISQQWLASESTPKKGNAFSYTSDASFLFQVTGKKN